MRSFSAIMNSLPVRIVGIVLVGAMLAMLVVAAVFVVAAMRPLERLPGMRPTPTTAPAPAAVVAARFDVQHVAERMNNAGMVSRWTTPGDEQIHITVAPEQITLHVFRVQDFGAALALVPMLFTDTAAGQLAQQVTRALMTEQGCQGAKAAGDVMVTAQVVQVSGGAMCEVVFA